ncbi:S-ribosylhomocysteine lyase, partial [Bifidobacteriaceae bacterium NR003]
MNKQDASRPRPESFELDHTKVKAPYVRYINTQKGPNGDVISNYDIRLTQPNEEAIPTAALHTIEHMIAVLLRERIDGYIDCSPFGCRTGFHLLTWGEHSTEDVARALKESLEFIAFKATWDDVP